MMPGDKKQLQEAINNFLASNELAVVATSSLTNEPEAATIGYFADQNFNFFFLSKTESRKIKNISQNPKVALVIGTTAGSNTLQIEGEAKIINPGENSFQDLLLKISQINPLYYGPLLKMGGKDFVIVSLKTKWIRFLDYNDLTGKEEFFELNP